MKKNMLNEDVQKLVEQEFILAEVSRQEDAWFLALTQRINEMIEHEFPALIAILYRLDVNEARLTQLLKNNQGDDAAKIIGELIIERQWQKVQSRAAFKKDNPGMDEDEKW